MFGTQVLAYLPPRDPGFSNQQVQVRTARPSEAPYPADSYKVSNATIKGVNRSYTYDAAGFVESIDVENVTAGDTTFQWTSFGQLREIQKISAPPLMTLPQSSFSDPAFAGIPEWTRFQNSTARAVFGFDAGGNRAKQFLERTFANGDRAIVNTRYLGSYEQEIHATDTLAGGGYGVSRTLHRHRLGGVVLTHEQVGQTEKTRMAVNLTDHIGSTDMVLRFEWNAATGNWKTSDGEGAGERQSFSAWGERRNGEDWSELRGSASAAQRTSAVDENSGFTGHEMLDDFGLIHMNGRIYDPELGRFLSADPFVQVPELSQNFNRYSYVLNNPLSMTDPSGNSWLKDNWVTVVVAVVVAVVTWGVGSYFSGAALAAGQSTTFATLGSAAAASGSVVAVPVTATLTATGMAVTGAVAGFVGGGLGAALSGGSGSDILRGALVGAVQGAISGGILHEMGIAAQEADFFSVDSAKWMAGHGIVGGASNEAMGGKFADGFFSAVAGAAIAVSGIYKTLDLGNPGAPGDNAAKMFGRTAISAIAGGTAAEIGGGKFANGAYTAAFQHLLNAEGNSGINGVNRVAKRIAAFLVGDNYGASWIDLFKSIYNLDLVNGPTGGQGIVPRFIANAMKAIQFDVWSGAYGNPGRNGMHAWHAGTNAWVAKEFGILGVPLLLLGGVFHETPFDWNSFRAENSGGGHPAFNGQGSVNHFLDSTMDVVSNIWGMSVGLVNPTIGGVKFAMRTGNHIPGPGDPDANFGGNGVGYRGNPLDAWGQNPFD